MGIILFAILQAVVIELGTTNKGVVLPIILI